MSSSSSSLSSVPVHSAIVLPLIVYYNDPQVYVAVCSAIYHIMSSADCKGRCVVGMCRVCGATPPTTGAVLQELAERAVGSTLEGLREHRENHICLEWGCRALRTLIMDRYVICCVILYVTLYVICCVMLYVTLLCHYSTDQKKYMEMCLALFDLISILEQQDSDPILLGEAFAAITCLTDISMSSSPPPGWCYVYSL